MRLSLALQSICQLVRPQFGAPVGVAIGAVGIPIGHEPRGSSIPHNPEACEMAFEASPPLTRSSAESS